MELWVFDLPNTVHCQTIHLTFDRRGVVKLTMNTTTYESVKFLPVRYSSQLHQAGIA